MVRNFLILSVALLLGGCLAQSRIQAKYMAAESDCRSQAKDSAEQKRAIIEEATPPGAQLNFDMTYSIASAFSDCMRKAGWKVTVPKPPEGTTTATTQPPSGAPGPGGTVALAPAPAAAAAAAPVAAKPVAAAPVAATVPQAARGTTTAAPILGPGVQPVPEPAFTAPAPAATTPAPAVNAPAARAPAPPTPSAPAVSQGGSVSTYQPSSRPDGVEEPDYGRGAGRNF